MIAIYAILTVMIIGAVIVIHVRDLLSSVIAVGVVGLGLSLIALIAKAPDVAITQLVVEIITVVILIRATIRRGLPRSPHESNLLMAGLAAVFAIIFLIAAAISITELPPLGMPTMRVSEHYLTDGIAETGTVNIVSAVLLDYRAYDTLGETTVLFAAVMGTLAVVRRVGRKDRDIDDTPAAE
ncbi:MAG: hydrogen gas-evolving membrane-bound hydrogenase subunit E [Candidatus Hydrogenedentota bacterium]